MTSERLPPGESQQLSLGLLGCGVIGRTLAAAVAVSGLGDLRLVYDLDPSRSHAVAAATGAAVAPSAADLLAHPDLSAVLIALPPALHCDAVIQAVRAGKHVFLEKPMALTSVDCTAMNAAVEQAGVSLMVGHVLRYFEPFRTVTRMARTGRFGEALHLSIWRLEHAYLDLALWKGLRSESGGYLFEIGAHDLDWLRTLLGEPTSVQAAIHKRLPSPHEIEDSISLQMQFSSGASAHYLGGAGFPTEEYGFRLHFAYTTLYSANAFDPSALQFDWHGPGQSPTLDFSSTDPFVAEITDWLDSLHQGISTPISGPDAARTVALIETAYARAASPRPS